MSLSEPFKVDPKFFDAALLECTRGTQHPGAKTKPGWNSALARAALEELAEVGAMLAACYTRDGDEGTAGAYATNLLVVLHRSYVLAGALLAPITREQVVQLLHAEQQWLEHLRRLPPPLAQEEEQTALLARPNGAVLLLALSLLRDLVYQYKPQEPTAWGALMARTRLVVGVAHAALNQASALAR